MNSQNLKCAHFNQLEISSVDFILVIVDTTAAPALYIVDQLSILSRCVALKLLNIPIHNEDFHIYSAAIGCGHIYDVTKV